MRKYFFLYINFILVFFLASTIYPESTIPFGKGYVRFTDLKRVFPELKLSIDTTILKFGLSYKNSSELQFILDSKFFSLRELIEPLEKPAIYIKKELYLPKEIVEAIFIYLLDREINYKFTDDSLVIDIEDKIPILPEEIKLESIVIDPGHGGKDPGATAVNGEYEKNYTIKIAKILKKYLKKKFPNLKIKLTRKKDEYVSLEERAKVANQRLIKNRSTIFVSIHCNSTQTPENSPTGFEVYYLAQTNSIETVRESAIISKRLVDTRRDPKVLTIQSGMMSSVIQRRSILLARSIDSKMRENLSTNLPSRGVKRNNYHVLRGTMMPAVLVELGFVTHPQDVKMLEEKAIQLKIAKGIAEGIKAYANAKY